MDEQADSINVELNRQIEQLDKVYDNLKDTETTLKRYFFYIIQGIKTLEIFRKISLHRPIDDLSHCDHHNRNNCHYHFEYCW